MLCLIFGIEIGDRCVRVVYPVLVFEPVLILFEIVVFACWMEYNRGAVDWCLVSLSIVAFELLKAAVNRSPELLWILI